MVSGPVCKKIEGTSRIFIHLGMNKRQKRTDQWDEFGEIVVFGGLNDTKKIRKASADIFAKFGLEKRRKNVTKSNYPVDF